MLQVRLIKTAPPPVMAQQEDYQWIQIPLLKVNYEPLLTDKFTYEENFITGLSSWREAVQRSVTSSQLSMALYTLEQCVAWDKSIMKAVNLFMLRILFYINFKLSFLLLELSILSIGRIGG